MMMLCARHLSKLSIVYIHTFSPHSYPISRYLHWSHFTEDTEEHRDEVTCPVCNQARIQPQAVQL